jgi:hypothetical protein
MQLSSDGTCRSCGGARPRPDSTFTDADHAGAGSPSLGGLNPMTARRRALYCTRDGTPIPTSPYSRRAHFMTCCAGSCSAAATCPSDASTVGGIACACAEGWSYGLDNFDPPHSFDPAAEPSDPTTLEFPYVPSGLVQLGNVREGHADGFYVNHVKAAPSADARCSHPRCADGACVSDRYFLQALNEWLDEAAAPSGSVPHRSPPRATREYVPPPRPRAPLRQPTQQDIEGAARAPMAI